MNKYLQVSYEDALRENALLKAKLEQAEKDLRDITYFVLYHEKATTIDRIDDALKAIRGK